jgi:hypothetical protein
MFLACLRLQERMKNSLPALSPIPTSCRKARQAKQPQIPKTGEFGGGEIHFSAGY